MKDAETFHFNFAFIHDFDYKNLGCGKFVNKIMKWKIEMLFNFTNQSQCRSDKQQYGERFRSSVINRKTLDWTRPELVTVIYALIYFVFYTSKLRVKNFNVYTPWIMKGKAKLRYYILDLANQTAQLLWVQKNINTDMLASRRYLWKVIAYWI